MIRMSKKTKKSRKAIRKSIDQYFGVDGIGLSSFQQDNFCACFEGGGGYVTANIIEGKNSRTIEIVSMEWEYDVKQFFRKF